MTLDYEHKIDRLKEVLQESDEFGERNVDLGDKVGSQKISESL
ncbi:MAG: hypothetical protein ACLFUR_05565 [Candidatus Hadarchaeia archaeon]